MSYVANSLCVSLFSNIICISFMMTLIRLLNSLTKTSYSWLRKLAYCESVLMWVTVTHQPAFPLLVALFLLTAIKVSVSKKKIQTHLICFEEQSHTGENSLKAFSCFKSNWVRCMSEAIRRRGKIDKQTNRLKLRFHSLLSMA